MLTFGGPANLPEEPGAPGVDAEILSQWTRVRDRLKSDVGEVEYRNWLRQMTFAGIDGDEVTIHLPTSFLRDWVRNHYSERLSALWQAENTAVQRLELRVGAASASVAARARGGGSQAAPHRRTR